MFKINFQCTPVLSSFTKFSTNFCQRRYSSLENKAACFPDRTLLFKDTRRYDHDAGTGITKQRMWRYFDVISRYALVAESMYNQNLVPIVHGQAAANLIAQRLLQALGFDNLRSLRSSNFHFLEGDNLRKKIDVLQKKSQWNLDHSDEVRQSMLACTIGLFNYESNESPVHFALGGGRPSFGDTRSDELLGNRNILEYEEIKVLGLEMITHAMKNQGFKDSFVQEILQKIEPLYSVAGRLDIGQILVVGVPYTLLSTSLADSCLYHSEAFGTPTGLSILEVLEKLDNGEIPLEGLQVRLLLSKELIEVENISMVNIMDSQDVNAFCKNSTSNFQAEILEVQREKEAARKFFEECKLSSIFRKKWNEWVPIELRFKEKKEIDWYEKKSINDYTKYIEQIDELSELLIKHTSKIAS